MKWHQEFLDQNIDEIDHIAQVTAQKMAELSQEHSPTVVFLKGNLGAGKTYLTQKVLHKLGLPQTTPVTSPTFTIMNDYQIGDDVIVHIDLYRFDNGFDLDDLLLYELNGLKYIFIEWPEKLSNDIEAHMSIEIEHTESGSRNYKIFLT